MTRSATRSSATSTLPAAASRSDGPRRPPGVRTIDLLPVLHDILAEHKAGHGGGLDDLLFPPARGGRRDKDNINKRVLKPVLERADELLADRSQHPLPRGVTPHKLRHTFASILIALGRDPRHVMDQLGHTDPKFTLRVYAHAMRFSEHESARLKSLVEGHDWAPLGTGTAEGHSGLWPFQWARRVSNLRPLACEASALPLSYAPQGKGDCTAA